MVVRVDTIPSETLASATYNTYTVDSGILVVEIEGGQRTEAQPSVGNLYPVVIDLYDDGSIMDMEIFFKVPPHRVSAELQIPRHREVGRVIVIQDKLDTSPLPVFWSNPTHSLLYIEAIDNPVQPVRHIQIADQIIVDVAVDGTVIGLWLLNVPPEVIEDPDT